MDVLVSRCAGIDIGKAEVVVCLRVPGPRGRRVSQVRTFSAVAGEMNRLADWLAEHQVSHVVMEATGQYWKPVWDVLAERGFELMLVNARHVKMVPGRKTDLLTELVQGFWGGCVPGGVRLARFAARDRRWRSATGFGGAGGAGAGWSGGDRRSVSAVSAG
jgi:transposase